jgi:hypothetical protein
VFNTQIHLRSGSEKQFAVQYENADLCMEINGVVSGCSPLFTAAFQYGVLDNDTVQAFLNASGAGNQSFYACSSLIEENEKQHRPGFQQSLGSWFEQQQRQPEDELLHRLECDVMRMPVSRKAVSAGRTTCCWSMGSEQVIRETWANQMSLPQGVKVTWSAVCPSLA